MKRLINVKLLLISLSITFFSCYADKGNYDYVDINVVSIHIGEKDSTFNVVSKIDTVRIYPKFSSTLDPAINDDTERYSFKWSIGDKYTSKNLVYPVDLRSGDYKLTLTVTDEITKLTSKASWNLKVSDVYQKGYIILTENENKEAQLDMISVFGDTSFLANISINSEMPIIKNPRKMFFCASGFQNREIHIIGDNQTYKLDRTAFSYNPLTGNLRDNFIEPGLYRDFNVTDIVQPNNSGGSRYIAVDGDVFLASNLIGTILFDFPINRYPGKYNTYKIADKLSVNYELSSNSSFKTDQFIMMYNTDENRFVFTVKSSTQTTDSVKNTKTDIDIFDWKTGLDFVTSVHSFFGLGDNFTILKDKVGGYFIYHYNMKGTTMGIAAPPTKVGKYDISDAPGIANAKFFCFSAVQPFFFYSSGSKIYGYDYHKNNKTFEMDMGGEITCLFDNPKSEGGKDFIYIATYGGTPNSGKLVKKHIINNPNIVGLEDPIDAKGDFYKFEFTGLNKVIDLEYK